MSRNEAGDRHGMNDLDVQPDLASDLGAPRGPRTATVLMWLTAAALALSYLVAYAGTNALVAADLLSAWPRDRDPRPRWMLLTFSLLLTVALCLAGIARFISWRQLRSIDRMEEGQEE